MATQVLLSTMIQRVRQRADLEIGNATTSVQAFPDSEVIDAINVALYAWWDLVRLTTFAGQYDRAPWPFTTALSQSLYPMPPNCASIISVDAQIAGANYTINAMGFQEEQRNMFTGTFGWAPGFWNVWYQIQGSNIKLIPPPPSGYSIQINYVPTAPQLSAPDDYFNSQNGWEEWVVLKAAIKLLLKDGQTDMIAALRVELADETTRIEAAAAMADMNSTEGVHEGQDTSNNGYGGFLFLPGWGS